MKKENTGRDNVLVLTIIAIVTMVIVVVGATFAYLASSVSPGGSSNIQATTEGGSDMLFFQTGEDIKILATDENFTADDGDLVGVSNAFVSLQTTSETEVTYKYKVSLEVSHNDFEYSSGTCYIKSEAIGSVAEDRETCKGFNDQNIWATVDGSGYACYNTSTPVGGIYSDEISCLINRNYMWEPENVAELVFDLYQTNDETNKATCENAGVCVNKNREVVSGISSKSDCGRGNTWLPNIYEDGMCYEAIKHADVTTLVTNGGNALSLLNNVNISATAGKAAHQYKAVITLINFGHNQIINGNKSFHATLRFDRITD